MPCFDGSAPYPPSREEVLDDKMPAVLCSLVSRVGIDQIIALVDWKEAGVTQAEFQEWWVLHLQRDIDHRQIYEQQERIKALRKQAKDKLTPEEIATLRLGD